MVGELCFNCECMYCFVDILLVEFFFEEFVGWVVGVLVVELLCLFGLWENCWVYLLSGELVIEVLVVGVWLGLVN